MNDTDASIITGLTASLAPTLGVIVIAIINGLSLMASRRAATAAQMNAAKAQDAAAKVQIDALAAQRATAVAQRQANDAARALIEAARNTDGKIDHIVETADKTHAIVNSANTKLLTLIETLTKRIAQENPLDVEAQKAAAAASDMLQEKIAVDAKANQGGW